MRMPSSLSEYKIEELYSANWKHNPKDWENKGFLFEENKNAGDLLNSFLNKRAHCKVEKI